MKKTYTGGCHCGAVRFEADIDLSAGSGKCNCSICSMSRSWEVHVKPADFRAVSGELELTDYRFGEVMHHLFCKHCGVRPYGKGFLDFLGGDFFAVNIACLENVEDAEKVAIPVRYYNGRHDNWAEAPEVVAHL